MTETDTETDADYAAYIAGLPRVLAGAGLLFRDGRGHVLIVEPNYREGWARGAAVRSGVSAKADLHVP